MPSAGQFCPECGTPLARRLGEWQCPACGHRDAAQAPVEDLPPPPAWTPVPPLQLGANQTPPLSKPAREKRTFLCFAVMPPVMLLTHQFVMNFTPSGREMQTIMSMSSSASQHTAPTGSMLGIALALVALYALQAAAVLLREQAIKWLALAVTVASLLAGLGMILGRTPVLTEAYGAEVSWLVLSGAASVWALTLLVRDLAWPEPQ
jgi:hypothetical protein